MREFSQFRARFWTGETGRRLRGNVDAQLLAAYLLTSCHANQIGLYFLPLSYVSHETGLPPDRVSAALDTLSTVGFARYDHDTEHVWIVNMARQQVTKSVKAMAGARKELSANGAGKLRASFENAYGSQLENLHSSDTLSLYPDTVSAIASDTETETIQYRDGERAGAPPLVTVQEPTLAKASPANVTGDRRVTGPRAASAAQVHTFDEMFRTAAFAQEITPPSLGRDQRARIAQRVNENAHQKRIPFEKACEAMIAQAFADADATNGNVALALESCEPGKPKPARPKSGHAPPDRELSKPAQEAMEMADRMRAERKFF